MTRMEEAFEIDGRQVTVRSEGAGGPVVYLHVFMGDGAEVWQACRDRGCSDFTLASIGNLAWDDDMSPWDCPPLTRDDTPCGGKALQQLARLTDAVMPKVEGLLSRLFSGGPVRAVGAVPHGPLRARCERLRVAMVPGFSGFRP